ncbi:hypothetical protein BDW27_103214 [Nocardiopsis sp. L17-MgMaSL7]|nr:hypothetical protein BDW27_103214 [Nocardiopsis sp. L17-MgMaSL7]
MVWPGVSPRELVTGEGEPRYATKVSILVGHPRSLVGLPRSVAVYGHGPWTERTVHPTGPRKSASSSPFTTEISTEEGESGASHSMSTG